MIRIAISQAAFEAIARTLPFGSVSFENKTNENGDRLIWLEPPRGRPPHGPARSRTELFRCHSAAGGRAIKITISSLD
jgi:hypothetical protein